MKAAKKNKRSKVGTQIATRILPFFAPLFLATVSAPSKTVEASGTIATHAMKAEAETKLYTLKAEAEGKLHALKVSNFQMSILQMYEELGLEKKGMSLEVFDQAMMGYLNLKNAGLLSEKQLLTVVDFDKPSTKKRFWLIDLANRKVLENTYVSHGKNSGNVMAEQFSNENDSNKSSLGFYVTGETYYGQHGLSLRLDGMDDSYNSNARMRDIVVHGAEYVSTTNIKLNGFLGRSLGCPALPMEKHKEVIDQIQDRTVLYLHSSKQNFNSRFLNQETAMEAFYGGENLI